MKNFTITEEILMKKHILTFLSSFLLLFLFIGCTTSTQDVEISKKKTDYSSLTDLSMPKDPIKLVINGKTLDLKSPIYLDKNRYYLCLNEII